MNRKLDNWLDAYMEYTLNTESAPLFHKWVGLSMLAAVLRKKTWLNFGRLRMYPNLYVVLVAEPGIARKTQAISYGNRLLSEIGSIHVSSDAITKEALIQEIEAAGDDTPMPDGTVFRHASLSIISREFESFLGQKKENTKMLVLLTDLFDCEELPWKYKTKSSGTNVAPAVFLNLLAATTPESLASSLPSSAIGGGLTTRMIFIWASGKTKKIAIPEDPPQELKEALIHDLSIISRIAGEYEFSPECRQTWIDWYETYDERSPRRICKDPAFHGWYSRKPMFIKKLAIIMAAAKSNARTIEWSHMEEAIDLLEEAELRMGKTFSAIGRSEITSDVDLIMSIVQQHKIISEKALLHMVWRDMDARKFDNVIDTAIRNGSVARKFFAPDGTQGIYYVWASLTGKDPNESKGIPGTRSGNRCIPGPD